MTALLLYDAARQALAEALSVDEVSEWEDRAAAVREYARRTRNREMEINALEIRVWAQRRRGELLAELKAEGRLTEGRKKLSSANDSSRLTLADLDTTLNESSNAQKLAAIEPDAFARLAARCRARLEENPEAHAFDVLRERDGPVNGARSVMGSRQEPDDSLDYFPTPPWATRALIERVLPEVGIGEIHSAWEPACGEGHIAGVLEEYVRGQVVATDIFDYSLDGRMPPSWWRTLDFLDPVAAPDGMPVADWIITNPPFGELTEKFVIRALEDAEIGVAMFVRLQWLESIGRYEAIFRDRPPTIIAFFAERVPLCKGRWDPAGSTATAYIWLVWVKDALPCAPFWIPPGQREALTRPGDTARFTARPVLPRHDPNTGEIIEDRSPLVQRSPSSLGEEDDAFAEAGMTEGSDQIETEGENDACGNGEQHVGRQDEKQRDEARVPSADGVRESSDEGDQGQRVGVADAHRGNGREPRNLAREDEDRRSRHVGDQASDQVESGATTPPAGLAFQGRSHVAKASAQEPAEPTGSGGMQDRSESIPPPIPISDDIADLQSEARDVRDEAAPPTPVEGPPLDDGGAADPIPESRMTALSVRDEAALLQSAPAPRSAASPFIDEDIPEILRRTEVTP